MDNNKTKRVTVAPRRARGTVSHTQVVSCSLDQAVVQVIDDLARRERKNRSQQIEELVLGALQGRSTNV